MKKREEILIKENSTLKLSKLIPIEYLEAACFTYQIIKQHEMKSSNSAKVILKGMKDIKSILTMFQGHGYLTEKNKDIVLQTLIKTLDVDDSEKLACILSELFIRKKEGKPRDKASEVLLYILLFNPMWNGNPDFKLIADFITEQGISENITDRALEKRYQRFKSEDALNALDLYRIIGILLKKLTPLERRQQLYELIKDKI